MVVADEGRRISADHALTVLLALRAGGVDVLARGPCDTQTVLHEAAEANAPAVVRWLVTEVGASPEETDSSGNTPLFLACHAKAWAAAHALLDCGARVDVQGPHAADGLWPVLLAVGTRDSDCALLRRMLAADRDSLLRRATNGMTALHLAAATDTDALQLLLGSGLPHLAEAINSVAVIPLCPDRPLDTRVTPLHLACGHACWNAALALLAAGARVDIAGVISGRLQTMADWVHSPDCPAVWRWRSLHGRGSTRRRLQQLPPRACRPAALGLAQGWHLLLPVPLLQPLLAVVVPAPCPQLVPTSAQGLSIEQLGLQLGLQLGTGSSRGGARAVEGRRATAQRSRRWTTK